MISYSEKSQTIEKTTVYSIGFSFWIVAKLLETTILNESFPGLNMPIKTVQFLGILLIIVSELFNSNHLIIRKIFIVVLFVVSLCSIPIILRKDISILQLVIMAFFGRDIKYSRFFKNLLIVIVVFRLIIFASAIFGIIPNVVTYRNSAPRYNLGYDWTTYSMQGYFYIVCMLIVLIKNNVNFGLVFLLQLINIVLYKLTDSRSPFMLITLLLVTWFLIKLFKFNLNHSKIIKFGSLAILPLMSSFILFVSINAERFSSLDTLLSGRLRLGKMAYQRYGLSVFGNNVVFNVNRDIYGFDYFLLDSSFLRIIFSFGLITFFVFLIVWTLLQVKLIRLKQGYYLFVLIFIVIHSTFDPQFLQAYYNLFIVLFGLFFINKQMAEENFSDL